MRVGTATRTRTRKVTGTTVEDYREMLMMSRVVIQSVAMCSEATRSEGVSRQSV